MLDGVLRPRSLTLAAGALAIAAFAWLGWSRYLAPPPRPPVPSVYAAPANWPQDSGSAVVLTMPDAAAPIAPAPAGPMMAYSAPSGRHGSFVPPVGGFVTQAFGPTTVSFEPPFTYHGTAYPHFHSGIDIEAATGTPVGASAAGVVIQVGHSDGRPVGYGNYVLIEHEQGYATLYAHLDRVAVTVGQTVRQLELIGVVGSTGLSTGPHLHFEVRRFGEFEDPLPYLLQAVRAW